MVGSTEKPVQIRRRPCGQRPFPWFHTEDPDEKAAQFCGVFSPGGKCMCKTVPNSQGGPEIKYSLQRGMSGKESSLTRPPGL